MKQDGTCEHQLKADFLPSWATVLSSRERQATQIPINPLQGQDPQNFAKRCVLFALVIPLLLWRSFGLRRRLHDSAEATFFSCVCLLASMARSVNCLGRKNAVQVHLIGAKPIVQVKR